MVYQTFTSNTGAVDLWIILECIDVGNYTVSSPNLHCISLHIKQHLSWCQFCMMYHFSGRIPPLKRVTPSSKIYVNTALSSFPPPPLSLSPPPPPPLHPLLFLFSQIAVVFYAEKVWCCTFLCHVFGQLLLEKVASALHIQHLKCLHYLVFWNWLVSAQQKQHVLGCKCRIYDSKEIQLSAAFTLSSGFTSLKGPQSKDESFGTSLA